MSTTHIGNDRCTRCGGGSSPCPVCNLAPETRQYRKDVAAEVFQGLVRLDAERTDRIIREAFLCEYGGVLSPILLGYVGKMLCHPDGTRQFTLWGRVIATVPPLIPKRQYGEPCFTS